MHPRIPTARNCDPAYDLQRFNTKISRSCHKTTRQNNKNYYRNTSQLCNRNGKHCDTYAKPSHLCKCNNCGTKPGTFLSESMSRHQIQGKSCLASHVTKNTGIYAKNRITDEQSPYKFCHVQTNTKLTADTHAGGEKGKAHHDHKHWQKTFSCAVRYRLKLVILLFLICLVVFHNILLLFFLAKRCQEYLNPNTLAPLPL